jgi:hypothetical protein
MTDVDAKLAALFATPPAAPDESFVQRIDRAVLAEEKMLAAQAAMWRRFAFEFAGTAAIIAAFYLLWKTAPGGIAFEPMAGGPGLAAIMVVFLWLVVQLRPTPSRRSRAA